MQAELLRAAPRISSATTPGRARSPTVILGPAGRKEAAIHAVRPPRNAAGRVVEHIGRQKVVPDQRDAFAGRGHGFVPKVGNIAGLAENGGNYGQRRVGEFGEQDAFNLILQVPGQGNVVGIHADGISAEFVAFEKEDMAGAAGRPERSPVTGAGGLGRAGLGSQADERVLAREADAVGVNGAGGHFGSALR